MQGMTDKSYQYRTHHTDCTVLDGTYIHVQLLNSLFLKQLYTIEQASAPNIAYCPIHKLSIFDPFSTAQARANSPKNKVYLSTKHILVQRTTQRREETELCEFRYDCETDWCHAESVCLT